MSFCLEICLFFNNEKKKMLTPGIVPYPVDAIPKNEEGTLITSLAPLVKTVEPAVGNIRVSETVKSRSPYDDEMFRRFFGAPNTPNNSREVQSAGSGVIVDAKNGYILTNHHVVSGADKIQISLIHTQIQAFFWLTLNGNADAIIIFWC